MFQEQCRPDCAMESSSRSLALPSGCRPVRAHVPLGTQSLLFLTTWWRLLSVGDELVDQSRCLCGARPGGPASQSHPSLMLSVLPCFLGSDLLLPTKLFRMHRLGVCLEYTWGAGAGDLGGPPGGGGVCAQKAGGAEGEHTVQGATEQEEVALSPDCWERRQVP